ncbi:amidase family protein [Actinopolyspora mortivallis]|uniref:amidase family protein n=1 Tax=Actinopolyspora mortivallis TaxID=33906 RepID=UPI0003686BF7|nr:amidase family protein [Actinopolyspora mortivallis]
MSRLPEPHSVRELAREFAHGRSAAEYAGDALDRCRAHRSLNAFVSLDADRVLRRARAADGTRPDDPASTGALHGVPIAVKDNIDVAGEVTTAGTPALRGNLARADAGVCSRLRQAGAVLFGKTNMHELAYGVTGENRVYGAVGNPVAGGRLPGGSSSGTAAAVAASLVPAGLGTDTGGSVRIPASCCGVTGFRPTTGRYPTGGVLRVSHTRDTVGILAGDVDDLLVLDGVLSGEADGTGEPERLPTRLVVPSCPGLGDVDAEVASVVTRAVRTLREHGWTLVEADFPPTVPELIERVSFPIALGETPACFRQYLETVREPTTLDGLVSSVADPDVRDILLPLCREDPERDEKRRRAVTELRPALAAAAAEHLLAHGASACLVPTTVLPAPRVGTRTLVRLNGRTVSTFPTYVRNTNLASIVGWPSVSIPAGRTERGLPVGLQLDAPAGTDRALLALARDCARVLAGTDTAL